MLTLWRFLSTLAVGFLLALASGTWQAVCASLRAASDTVITLEEQEDAQTRWGRPFWGWLGKIPGLKVERPDV